MVVAAPEAGFPGGVSATIEGWVVNGGTITGSTRARLVLGSGRYSGLIADRISVPLTVAAGTFAPGPAPFRVPSLGWSRQTFELDVAGLAGGSADQVVVAGRRRSADRWRPGERSAGQHGSGWCRAPGYVPCAGARLQLLTWGQRVAGEPVEPQTVTMAGLAPGLEIRLVERFDGLVAEVTGSSAGVACSDTVGDRLVSGWFVDGLGRPARPEQLTWFGARADTAGAPGRRGA